MAKNTPRYGADDSFHDTESAGPDAATIRDISFASTLARLPSDDGIPYVVVPSGYSVHDLEGLLAAPNRTSAKVTVRNLASLESYVKDFKADKSRGFAQDNYGGKSAVIKVVLDYDGADKPSHRSHVVTLHQEVSEQWSRWSSISGLPQSQTKLAEFLEENSQDVWSPPTSDLLELTRTFEATKSGAFRGGVRLTNGSFQLSYSEEVSGSAAGGTISVPERIIIRIPIFRDGPEYDIAALFRYRIVEGKLALIIEIHRKRFVFETAWRDLLSDAESKLGLPIHIGEVAD